MGMSLQPLKIVTAATKNVLQRNRRGEPKVGKHPIYLALDDR